MALHGLASITVGVPNVAETVAYYEEFGLEQTRPAVLASTDGGEQLTLVETPRRRLVEVAVRAQDADDIERCASRLHRLGLPFDKARDRFVAVEPITGVRTVVMISEPMRMPARPAPGANAPGVVGRPSGQRAPATGRHGAVRPRRLGHVVLGTPDQEATVRFYTEGMGFKVSDYIPGHGAFLRCSTDHHNLLVLGAPVPFLHHSSWEVDDVDEVGRGAMNMLTDHPERHVWGLGRHYAGSNFFYYLKDPAGNFSEYFSDMDCIVDDQLWKPEECAGASGLFAWGPPPPPSFLHPEDLAALMTGSHSAA
ncbi:MULTISPECIES: VOC family protein [unclassified Pseudofrankia]|uniref:VOC family protein n=1 Tax=unclassified Pseudofrankia TaxID=2994372 RepID=UPI0008D92966|nr:MULTISPECIES: VOC family protein [unclassified Pseudofrankia]MDT3445805.1 VOC family protein [Pseudofrankia sp. BMG5.37]OHV57573.1 dioxygenase [Pseudofrankia sp. BMG5.36]